MISIEIYTSEQKIQNSLHDKAWEKIREECPDDNTQTRRERFRAEFPHHSVDYAFPTPSPSTRFPDAPCDRRQLRTARVGGFDDIASRMVLSTGKPSGSMTLKSLFAPLMLEQTGGWINPSYIPTLRIIQEQAIRLCELLTEAYDSLDNPTEEETTTYQLGHILVEFIEEAISLTERDYYICLEIHE